MKRKSHSSKGKSHKRPASPRISRSGTGAPSISRPGSSGQVLSQARRRKARARVKAPDNFYDSIAEILRSARANAYRAVNFVMVEAYWNVGRRIVEEEQKGHERAEYGASLINNLAGKLSVEFGKGYDASNLWNFRQFYLAFQGRDSGGRKLDALRRELTWTHYRLLMRVEKRDARAWYLNEAVAQNWSTRALRRQINTLYYERMRFSKDKSVVIREMDEMTAPLAPTSKDFIKDAYVFDFLGLKACLHDGTDDPAQPGSEELRGT